MAPGDLRKHQEKKCGPACLYCIMERPFAPAELELASAEGDVYFGFNAQNECCGSWVLLGWPVDKQTNRPKKANEGELVIQCPKCGGKLRFNLSHPDVTARAERHQPPALARGRIRGR